MSKKFIKNMLFLPLCSTLLLLSCSKKPDLEYTSTYKMSGEWFARYYTGGNTVTDFHKIITYNTSDPNSNQVWVDDLEQWPFKAKLNVDYQNLTFKAVDAASNTAVIAQTIKVLEGKILPGVGRSKSGNAVDSIYLRLEFSDDPGTIYELRGHQRTGFFEDEY